MIDKIELRPGSIVFSKHSNKVIEVSSIVYRGVNEWHDMGASGEEPYEDLFPVPVTEYILIQLGFFKTAGGQYQCDDLTIEYTEENGWAISPANCYWIEFSGLHQLQNILLYVSKKQVVLKV